MADMAALSDDELKALFQQWDANGDGQLSLTEVENGLRALRLPCSPADLAHYRERFAAFDTNRDGSLSSSELASLSFADFVTIAREKEAGLRLVFDALDTDRSGFLDLAELRQAVEGLNIAFDEAALTRLFRRMDANHDGRISFNEFRQVLLHVPDFSLATVLGYWQKAATMDLDGEGIAAPTALGKGHEGLVNSMAGAVASVLAKTSTAPIERLKILFQQYQTTPPSMIGTLRNIYRGEGVRGLFRGNLVNLMKSTPESAVKFAVFEKCKTVLDPLDERELTALEVFACGGAGGVAAHASGFPLEVLKTKLAGSPAGTYTSLANCISTVYRTEGGVMAFYRGLTPTVLSTIPHAGTSLASYQLSKDWLTGLSGEQHTPGWALVSAATISTICGTTVATPLHVIKTRVIMRQAPNGSLALIGSIWRNEGAAGFMRGFAPSMVKGIPAHIVSFSVFELFRRAFGITKKHKHGKH